MLGQKKTNLIGQPDTQVFADWPNLVQQYRNIQETRTELEIDTAAGLRHIELRIKPLHDQDEQIYFR